MMENENTAFRSGTFESDELHNVEKSVPSEISALFRGQQPSTKWREMKEQT